MNARKSDLRLAPGLLRTKLENRSLYDVLRRQYGHRIVRAERWIDAVLPDASTCELLGLDEPEPLLRIRSGASSVSRSCIRCHGQLTDASR